MTDARRPAPVAAGVVSLLAVVLVGCSHGGAPAPPEGLPCHAAAGTESYALDAEQAANATTIAAIGKRIGLPDHAVTVALAAALQESKLHNLTYGDRDSLGLFQQRPSQGWGTKDQILDPRYAATAFYTHLAKVARWETLAVTDAAQAVQISGGPDAYARWEAEARVLAQALTGELPAAFTCRTTGQPLVGPGSGPPFTTSRPANAKQAQAAAAQAQAAAINHDLAAELGSPALGAAVASAQGWTIAAWLIGHAGSYGVATVTFGGQRWSGHSGAWSAHLPVTSTVEVNR